jgi:hypothetical protein
MPQKAFCGEVRRSKVPLSAGIRLRSWFAIHHLYENGTARREWHTAAKPVANAARESTGVLHPSRLRLSMRRIEVARRADPDAVEHDGPE